MGTNDYLKPETISLQGCSWTGETISLIDWLIELILHCDTATEECVSNDFFRHSLDDSRHLIWHSCPAHPWIPNTVELIVIHNSPCEHSSRLQLSIRFTPSRCLDVRQNWYPMYYPEGMKARVSSVQSIEPHRILALTRDSNQEPPGPQPKVVTIILPLPHLAGVLMNRWVRWPRRSETEIRRKMRIL